MSNSLKKYCGSSSSRFLHNPDDKPANKQTDRGSNITLLAEVKKRLQTLRIDPKFLVYLQCVYMRNVYDADVLNNLH